MKLNSLLLDKVLIIQLKYKILHTLSLSQMLSQLLNMFLTCPSIHINCTLLLYPIISKASLTRTWFHSGIVLAVISDLLIYWLTKSQKTQDKSSITKQIIKEVQQKGRMKLYQNCWFKKIIVYCEQLSGCYIPRYLRYLFSTSERF